MRAPCACYLLLAVLFAAGWSLFAADHTTDTGAVMLQNLKEGKAVIVDVRTEGEWAESRLQQAYHIPLADWKAAANQPDGLAKLLAEKLPAGKIVYVHCQAGVRSKQACSLAEKVNGWDLRALKLSYEELVELGLPTIAGK